MAEKMTKQEAVRRALGHFGRDGKPSQMQGWIKDQFGIDMSTDHVSTAKGIILRAARKGKRAARKGVAKKAAAQPEPAPKPQASPRAAAGNGKQAGIPLDDILCVKALVGRFGPDQLHTLIDAFAK